MADKKIANRLRTNASKWSDDVLPTLLHVGVRFGVLMFSAHSQ